VSKGYIEGPAAEEAERRREELDRPFEAPHVERPAVYGGTAEDARPHFLGWLGEVDPDELFNSGQAWGITIRRQRVK
jgi:hypothetical protein